MRKIITSVLALGMLSFATTVSASSNKAEHHIGYSHLTTLNGQNANGLEYGIVKMWTVSEENTDALQYGLGINWNINSFQTDSSDNGTTADSITYGFDGDALIGYQINQNINVRGGIGYSFNVIASSAFTKGVIYCASAGYKITDKLGLEATYKAGTVSFETALSSQDVEQTQLGLNVVWGF